MLSLLDPILKETGLISFSVSVEVGELSLRIYFGQPRFEI